MDADQDADFPQRNISRVHSRLLTGARARRNYRLPTAVFIAPIALILTAFPSIYAADVPNMLPDTAIAPAESGSARATPAPRHYAHPAHTPGLSASENAAPTPPASAAVHHHASPHASPTPIPNLAFEVEPADARVPLRNNAVAYLQPSQESPQVEQLQAGQLVRVTGSTRFFLQIKLKNGGTAYVLSESANLTVPADKIFRLTSDTPVLARPNKWARQLAEVHQGHDVQVIGVALNYMRIRMKSGLEGYITVKSLE